MPSPTRHVRFADDSSSLPGLPSWPFGAPHPDDLTHFYDTWEEELAAADDRPLPVGPEPHHAGFSVDAGQWLRPSSASFSPREEHSFIPDPPIVNTDLRTHQPPLIPTAGPWSFLSWFPEGSATLTYCTENNTVETLPRLDLAILQERCPLIAQAFEDTRSGQQLHLDALTPTTALPFVRFLYMGSYATDEAAFYDDVPTSLLLHCQLYRLGDIYDLPDLRSQAYVNVLRQCEFGCSSAAQPIDLCPAIRYAYEHLSDHRTLIENIIHYCIACFLTHRLAEDPEFKKLSYDLRPFHQDLCKESRDRGFENETAAAIIQMPFKAYVPETYASRDEQEWPRIKDVVYHFHSTDSFDLARDRTTWKPLRKPPSSPPAAPPSGSITLPVRQKRDFEACDTPPETAQPRPISEGSGRKRRALSSTSSPGFQSEGSTCSDAEYELVPRPAPVEVLDSSDSECELLALPIRSARNGLDEYRHDPDSEWSLVEPDPVGTDDF